MLEESLEAGVTPSRRHRTDKVISAIPCTHLSGYQLFFFISYRISVLIALASGCRRRSLAIGLQGSKLAVAGFAPATEGS
jgi:hypothetical protein